MDVFFFLIFVVPSDVNVESHAEYYLLVPPNIGSIPSGWRQSKNCYFIDKMSSFQSSKRISRTDICVNSIKKDPQIFLASPVSESVVSCVYVPPGD